LAGRLDNSFDTTAGVRSDGGVALHEDEIEIDLTLVRALVDRALPDLAGRPLRALHASGSSNALFRLGDDLLVRLPRQPGGAATITKEARWLPHVAPALPVRVPCVVAVGEPDLAYPERWSVVRWLDGQTPTVPAGPDEAAGLARDLAEVVGSLAGLTVPVDALEDPALRSYRGEPLAAMDAATRAYLAECRKLHGLDLDIDGCLHILEATMALAGADRAVSPRWLHGDLLAENLLVRDGKLVAVLDFGVLAVGDPTVDLVVAWELLDPPGRDLFRSLVGVDEATWLRARAWALAIAAMTLPYYWATMPDRCAARLTMARAVLADAAGRSPKGP
jgi:aminoglycoside phosphotransferase (APT) family kinase protein